MTPASTLCNSLTDPRPRDVHNLHDDSPCAPVAVSASCRAHVGPASPVAFGCTLAPGFQSVNAANSHSERNCCEEDYVGDDTETDVTATDESDRTRKPRTRLSAPTTTAEFRAYHETIAHQHDQFWERVSIGGLRECWPFMDHIKAGGHGIFPAVGEVAAHRVSWTMVFGPIPDGVQVLHNCDIRNCVNPRHLKLGSDVDNSFDKSASQWAEAARICQEAGERIPHVLDRLWVRSVLNRSGVKVSRGEVVVVRSPVTSPWASSFPWVP